MRHFRWHRSVCTASAAPAPSPLQRRAAAKPHRRRPKATRRISAGDVTAVMESVTVAQPPVRHISFRWCADVRHRNHSWSAYVLPSGAQLTAEHVSELREQARHTYVDLGLRVSSIEDGTASTGLMRPVKPHAIWPGY